MKYEYQGEPGTNPCIVGKVAKGDEIDASRVQPGALAGVVNSGALVPIKAKQLKGAMEDSS